jgi:hypothetical protein
MRAARATSGSSRTTDHHGRRVTLLDPYPLMLLRRFDRIDEPTVEAVLADLGDEYTHIKRNMWFGLWSLVAVVVVTAVGLGLSVTRQGPGALRDLWSTVTAPSMLPIMFAAIGGGVIAPWFAMRAKRYAILRGVILGHHRCPHCGYGIRSVPATDGAVVCPECAAAWPEGEVGVRAARGDTDGGKQRQMMLVVLGLGLTALLGALVMFWAF